MKLRLTTAALAAFTILLAGCDDDKLSADRIEQQKQESIQAEAVERNAAELSRATAIVQNEGTATGPGYATSCDKQLVGLALANHGAEAAIPGCASNIRIVANEEARELLNGEAIVDSVAGKVFFESGEKEGVKDRVSMRGETGERAEAMTADAFAEAQVLPLGVEGVFHLKSWKEDTVYVTTAGGVSPREQLVEAIKFFANQGKNCLVSMNAETLVDCAGSERVAADCTANKRILGDNHLSVCRTLPPGVIYVCALPESEQRDCGQIGGDKPDQFPCRATKVTGLNFGEALEALKAGKRVSRTGWNGKGMYLWLLPAAKVKAEWCKEAHLKELAEASGGEIEALASIRMKTADGKVLTGWLASQSDMLAEDFHILPEVAR